MHCSICNDTTFTSSEKDGETIAIACVCRKERLVKAGLEKKLIESHVPRKFWGCTIEDYFRISKKFLSLEDQNANKNNIEIIRSYIERPDIIIERKLQVIWIWGTDLHCNSCHTTLAVLLGIACMKINVSVRFISMQNLLNALINFEEKEVFFKEFNKYKVFIIDDAFDGSRCIASGNYTQIHLFNWFNDAMNARKILICTSNTPLKNVDAIYEQSKIILSRDAQELEIVGSFSPVDIKNFLLKEG